MPTAKAAHIVRFAVFEVDLRNSELRRSGVKIKLQSQPFQILAMLLEHPGELVTREDLRGRLWPADTFVDFEHSLNTGIKRLREALGDSAERPVYIETIPRRGYRFLLPIQEAGPDPAFPATKTTLRPSSGRRISWVLVAGVVLFLGGLIAKELRRVPFVTSHASTPPVRVVPFTSSPGAELSATFSPDGKELAFIWARDGWGNADVYVKLIGGDQPLAITKRAGSLCNPAWSPDGRYLAFQSTSGSVGTFIIPALSGPERRLSTSAACHGLSWSADGKFLAYPVRDSADERWKIALLSLDTLEERAVTSPPANLIGDHQPCFSPDSTKIAFTRLRSPWVTDLYVASIDAGDVKRLTFDNTVIWGCAWAADGRSIVITSHRGGDLSLWRVPVDGGSPERLSVASPNAFYPAISRQGDKLAYQNGALHTNIWRLDLDTQGRPVESAKPLMQSTLGEVGPNFSPDGSHIVFGSEQSGFPEIWIAKANGSDPIQLTSLNVLSGSARWSPDSSYIAFDSRPANHSQIFVIPSVGGRPRQLTPPDWEASVPTWSRDGQWIYFTSNRLGMWQLFKVRVEGGEPIQVTAHGGFIGFESTDSGALYYVKDNDYGIWRMPLPSGQEKRIVPVNVDWGRWALTSKGIYFVDTSEVKPTITLFNFADRKIYRIKTITKSMYHGVPAFDVAPDDRTILFLQVEMNSDIMLVENFH